MAAFQHEMGASAEAVDDNSDWYVWLHDERNKASNVVSGDVPEHGPGYWDLYGNDHEWARWLGLNAWRTNIEWSRIFPNSTRDVKVTTISDDEGIKDIEVTKYAVGKLAELADGNSVRHYKAMFRDLKAKGMKLVLNLHHWTMPIWIHDAIGVRDKHPHAHARGWADEETVVEFSKYAAYVAWEFDDLVDMWSTMTEPNLVWNEGYVTAKFPPGLRDARAAERVAFNLAQAHARAFDQVKRHVGKRARVGVMYATSPSEPLTDSSADKEAARTSDEVSTKRFFEAVIDGRIRRGFGREEMTRADMRNKVDWIGVNYFSRTVVKWVEVPPFFEKQRNYGFLCQPHLNSAAGRPTSDSGWEIHPDGIRRALELYKEYDKPLFVTSNGIADAKDRHRAWYILSHLHNIRLAIEEGLNVIGYLHWSLIDNLEWGSGFSERFGLMHVDMRTKKRSPRPSAFVFRDVVQGNGLPGNLSEHTRWPNALRRRDSETSQDI